MSGQTIFHSFAEAAPYLLASLQDQQPQLDAVDADDGLTGPDWQAGMGAVGTGVPVGDAESDDTVGDGMINRPTEMQANSASPVIHDRVVDTPAADSVSEGSDLAALIARLQAASLTLARVVRQDQEARTLALRDLERYDALVAAAEEAEGVARDAARMRAEAEALIEGGFADEARSEARAILAQVTDAASIAECVAQSQRTEAEVLAGRLDLERLLAERQRQQEAEQARAAAAERAERLSGALARAREALDAGRFEEAKELVGHVASEDPENSGLNSLRQIIAQREFVVKVTAAEAALRRARHEFKRQPAEAIAVLEALDVDGLPEHLSREVFGEWASNWSKQCRAADVEAPLRYAPQPGRGAILARDTHQTLADHAPAGAQETSVAVSASAPYKVLGALGMGPQWRPGTVVSPRQVERARPLR